MKLQNKVAIITGGGKGIGAEISLRLAKEGAKIVIAEKDIESAENIKKKIIENKGDAIVVDTNVANEDSVNQMAPWLCLALAAPWGPGGGPGYLRGVPFALP